MNWGNRVLLVFVLFGGGMSYMVWRCIQMPVDLVSKEYYKEELAYQQVIDGTRHANALSAAVELVITAEGVRIKLPAEMRQKSVEGAVRFYCAADAARDRKVTLAPDAEGNQLIPRNMLVAGQYIVSVNWDAAGTNYFSQQAFVLH